VKGG
jgi:hypothetical protein